MTTIFCFTSTGNSLVVAKQLAERTGGEVVSMTKEVAACNDKKIGFVFPAYFWGIPKIVERFVRKLEITNPDVYVFAVVTYGGRVHGVTGIFKRWLSKKGIVLNYSVKIKSVENYIPMYKVNNNDEIHVKYLVFGTEARVPPQLRALSGMYPYVSRGSHPVEEEDHRQREIPQPER